MVTPKMKEITLVPYKGKTIIYTDWTNADKSKDKELELINAVCDAYIQFGKEHGENSVLGLTNVSNIKFDMEILKAFKDTNTASGRYQKKLAIIGIKGLLKAGYNFVIGLTDKKTKVFETEQEAKEWLVSD